MSEPRYYMACLDLRGRSVLVVGAGRVAHEKILGLLECGAAIKVVAPEVLPAISALDVVIERREYRSTDLHGRFLVVVATSTTALNRRVFAEADARGILCNVVDVPALCSFILPAVHRVDPIAVAVSTGGASPALAQRLRDDIAAVVRPEHAELAHRLRELRPWAKEHLPTYEARKEYFQRVVEESLS